MKISIIGTGYVGLVTGLSLANLGHQVSCVDIDKNKVSQINSGTPPFFEPGVAEMLTKIIKQKKLLATDNLEKSVKDSEIVIVAVGTPTTNNKIDLSIIKKASEQIGNALEESSDYKVITVKSTVLPGTTAEIIKPTLEKYSKKTAGKDFGLCMNPEFLREGNALEDAMNPDRIVIGQLDEKSGQEFAKIYSKLSSPKIFTNLWTAELIKYTSNSLFATLISFANEISRIAEAIGKVDVLDVWKGVHLDKRLNPIVEGKRINPAFLSYLLSGCGFGGSCFPKDIQALATFASEHNTDASLIKSVININDTQPGRVVSHLQKALVNLKGKKIAVLGLAFKPETDDTRESPALPIVKQLTLEGAEVVGHDPMAKVADIIQVDTIKEALGDADAAVVVTSWKEYRDLTPDIFKQYMKQPILIDARRIYDKRVFSKAGITYKGIGLA